MFTGIIKERGRITVVEKTAGSAKLRLEAPGCAKNISPGASLAVNGVCLTVAKIYGDALEMNILEETFEKSNLRGLMPGDAVNLERSVGASGTFDGHFVTGHVDTVSKIARIGKKGADTVLTIEVPERLMDFIAPKGSIAVDGISLTVVDVQNSRFSVHVIPHTLKMTTLGIRRPGEGVNIEVDIIARYAVNALGRQGRSKSGISAEFLEEKGFL